MKKKKGYYFLLIFSVFFSISLHVGAVFWIYNHFFKYIFCSNSDLSLPKNVIVEKVKEEDIVTFAFEISKKEEPSLNEKEYLLKKEKENKVFFKFSKEKVNLENFEFKPEETLFFDKKEELIKNFEEKEKKYKDKYFDSSKKICASLDKFSKNVILEESKQDLLNKKDEIFNTEKEEKESKFLAKAQTLKNYPIFLKNNFLTFKEVKEPIFFEYVDIHENPLKRLIKKIKEEKPIQYTTSFHRIPTLGDLKTISCSDNFDFEIEYISKHDEIGYIFALLLIPKPEFNKFQRIKQNFYFLMDRSNSIQNRRLTFTRHAILSSLSKLNKEDNFNILAFDHRVELLFNKAKNPLRNEIFSARKFLSSQRIASFFSSTNFFVPLNHALADFFNKEDEINNIILITNGEGLKKNKNRNLIKKFTEFNRGRNSFYSLAFSDDKNLSMLDFFSSLNKGELIVSTTLRGIKRHLLKLVKSLEYPIAKNISISVFEKEGNKIELYSPQSKKTNLYLNQPLIILGSVENLEDFTIFIQGQNPTGWFNIKKKISFLKANKGDKALRKRWAQHKAYKLYNDYLADGNKKHLEEAEKFLNPLNKNFKFK